MPQYLCFFAVLILFALSAEGADAIPPYYVTRENLEYPVSALKQAIEGKVAVEITVSTSGDVVSVNVLESIPKRTFDEAAINAFKKSKYRPRCKEGFAKAFKVKSQVQFKLSSGSLDDAGFQIETNSYGATETLEPERTAKGIRLSRVDLCGVNGRKN